MNSPLVSAANFQPKLDSIRLDRPTYFKSVCNPTSYAKRHNIYQPRITYYQRHLGGHRMSYELVLELSLPKLIYGNNFDELVDSDFDDVIKKLQTTLQSMNIWLFSKFLEQAEVRAIHYSKNIIFTDYTSCSSVLRYLSQADISKRYDIQRTNFRNGGHILHVHTNSMDIAFYDKLADLRQAKISEKRAIENDNYIQLNLLDALESIRPLSVLRYELRLGRKGIIKQRLKEIGFDQELTFEKLFNKKLSQKILIHHWKSFFDNTNLLSLDSNEPDKVFANILKDKNIKPQQALAKLGFILLRTNTSARYARKLVDDRFGSHVWSRIKKLSRDPPKTQYESLLAISCELVKFIPTKLSEIDT